MNTGANTASADNPARLLIVDDHALVRDGLRTMLEREPDLEVVGEAENGRIAVRMCRALFPDIILMDVRMPEMDGIEATLEIKTLRPTMSVLMVTAHRDPDYLLRAVQAGASGYVLKESPKPQLLNAVRRVLAGENALNQELAMKLISRVSAAPANGSLGAKYARGPIESGEGATDNGFANVLSARERDVLRLVASGLSNRQISHELMVSLSSVKTYVQRILGKLGVSDRTQASVKALRMGLLTERVYLPPRNGQSPGNEGCESDEPWPRR